MNTDEWQKTIEKIAMAWEQSRIGTFAEIMSVDELKPNLRTKISGIIYSSAYHVAYYPIRLAWLIWDGIEDAFGDAWG